MGGTKEPQQARSPDTNGTATVLIAEDHYFSRDALRSLLEVFGYHVLEAGNGAEAVELALADPPDLVLMDIMMPILDGFAATRELRRHRATRHIPIIAVTAMEGAKELALQAGVDDVVRKPVDTRVLLAKMGSLLKARPPS
jgi:two-component system, cell cycle response regulator